jgi:CRISPR-associated endonuclease/helicase Cas3
LNNVAEMARSFAEEFGADDWGYAAGLWHDIGKYSAESQDMLRATEDSDAHIETKPGRVDHATAGAQHASKLLGNMGKFLTYRVAVHHTGLQDGDPYTRKRNAPFQGRQANDAIAGGATMFVKNFNEK